MAHSRPDQAWHQHIIDNILPRLEMSAATTLPAATPGDYAPVSIGLQSLQPGFDPVETLPPAAAERLRQLRQRSEDAHAVVPDFESIRQASMAKVEAANAVKRYTDPASLGGFNLHPSNGQVVAAQKNLDKLTDDLQRLQQLSEVRTAAWQSTSAALQSVETYLRFAKPGNTVVEAVDVDVPKPAKGEAGLLDQIETRRRRVRELKADLHRIASAPYPSAHARAKVRQEVEALAQIGQPALTNVIEHDGKIVWPSKIVQSEVYTEQRALAFTEQPDALALIAYLLKPQLIAALDREIDAEADDPASLSHTDREVRAAEVQADLVEVERVEAELVFEAWSKNLPVEHRSDVSPLALLGVRLVTSPRAAPAGTSVGHGYSII
jgi:hypothetical protein